MYNCSDCGRYVKAKADDPIHYIKDKKLCTGCVRKSFIGTGDAPVEALPEPEAGDKPEVEGATRYAKKSDAKKAYWAKMPPEVRAARIAKMRAGLKTREVTP